MTGKKEGDMKKILTFFLACTVLLLFAVPAYAVGYNPSPGDDPKIIIEGDETLMLVTTPIECVGDALHVEIQKMLDRAWAQIYAANTLADLTPEIIPALEAVKAESSDPMVKALTVEDLVVCDLFDVSLIKNKTEFVHSDPSRPITFSVKTNLRPGDVFFIMHNYEGNNWEMVYRYDLSGDGVLLIALDSISPMAIAVPHYYNQKVDYSGPVSPQTDERSSDMGMKQLAALSGLTLILAAGTVFIRKNYLFGQQF